MVMDGGSVISQQAMQQTNSIHAGQQEQAGDNPFYNRVAREFVRQYYTILHESPVHLHRFYNDESDFIHGSIESPAKAVRGQHDIHQTILGLNFQNCFAKILYVDAQESVDKSVVVQVAGELSNSGGPMRRFMQTFLLVPLSTRKYYVRNDIFRYQDEIYVDDQDEMNANEVQNTSQQSLVNGGSDMGTTNGTTETKEEVESNQWDNSIATAQNTSQQQPPQAKSPPSQPTPTAQETSAAPVVKVPASWSQMVQKPAGVAPPQSQPASFGQSAPTFGGASTQPRAKTGPAAPRPNGTLPPKKDLQSPKPEEDAKPAIPDNQQLFVGNIPVQVTESNLVDMFSKFGKVLEFKLGPSKNANGLGKTTPNYGFVIFESAETVQKFLKNKEDHFEMEDGKTIRLNIEEKKPRERLNKGPRPTGPPRDRRQMTNGNNNKRDFSRDNGRPQRSGPPRPNPRIPQHQ